MEMRWEHRSQRLLSWLLVLVLALSLEDALHGEVTLEPQHRDHHQLHRALQVHHRHLHHNLGEDSAAPVDLQNCGFTQFVGTVGIGSPPQDFRVIFDTGSSNTWLPSESCRQKSCSKFNKYDSSKSSTYHDLGVQNELGETKESAFFIKYGSGMVRGDVVRDDVSVGSIKLKKARFGEVTYEAGHAFSKGHFAGIVGLAFPDLAAANMYPLFDQMIDQKVLKNNEFGFYLPNRMKSTGKLLLGDSAEGYYKGDITAHDVIDHDYWNVKMVDVKIGSTRMNLCGSSGCKVALDSGTSLITGPHEHVASVLKKLQVDHDCANWEDIPSISLLLEAKHPDGTKYVKEYDLQKHEFVFEMKNHLGVRKSCTPGLRALNVPAPRGPLWILGDLFMMKYFTQYSRTKNQVHIAEAKHISPMQEFSDEVDMTDSLLQFTEIEEKPSQQAEDISAFKGESEIRDIGAASVD